MDRALDLRAKLFRGLGDPSRLAVLECLLEHPRCVSEIVARTSLSQPNVSNHLACLRDCGLVKAERAGRFVFYSVADSSVGLMLAKSRDLIGRIEVAMDACPNYEDEANQRSSKGA